MVVSHPKNYEFDADEAFESAEVTYTDLCLVRFAALMGWSVSLQFQSLQPKGAN